MLPNPLTGQGSALYFFGCTGPSFGIFQVQIDDCVYGNYNASTTVETYGTLLFFATHLDAFSASQHKVVITNRVDGMMFALDCCVAVQAGSSATSAATTAVFSTNVAPGIAATSEALFPSTSSIPPTTKNPNGSAGAIVGGVLGTLAGLVNTIRIPGRVGADAKDS